MANNSIPVVNYKVAVIKMDELKVSQKGTPYLKFSFLNKDDGDTWYTGMAFGLTAKNLANVVKKGNKMLVTGSMRSKEYQKKDGTPGVEKIITVESAKVSDGTKLVTVDEFFGA